jgi:hypothetical protein
VAGKTDVRPVRSIREEREVNMKRFLFAVIAVAMLPLAAIAQTNTFPSSGNVGIGTVSPTGKLDVFDPSQNSFFRSSSSTGYSRIFVNNDAGGGFYMLAYGSAFGGTSTFGGLPNNNLTLLLGTGANGLVVGTSGAYPIVFSVFGADSMRIDSAGNVGIGQSSPSSRLDVNGSFHASGNAVVDGNIAAKYQDVAEWVETSVAMKPGTVVVLDRENANEVIPSAREYDTAVAGVVSEKPGLLLGEESPSKVKIATTGRVKVHVDATKHPIMIGDLLVSGPHSGTAIKSQPVSVAGIEMHRPGTVIGKALEPLASGEGEILVLLSLQ